MEKPNGVRSQMGSEYQDKKWYFFRPSKLRRLRLLLMYSSFLNAFELESMRARERGLDFHLLWGEAKWGREAKWGQRSQMGSVQCFMILVDYLVTMALIE